MSLDTGTTPSQSGGTGVGASVESTTPTTSSSGAIPGSTMEIVKKIKAGESVEKRILTEETGSAGLV